MPKISVIVPAYNAQACMEKCMDSILNQTFRDLELILVDDGSTDETPAIADAYAAADPRVKVIHQPNGGVSAARNTALDAATGELIAFVDTDDYLMPEAYEQMLSVMEKHQTGAALCNFLAEAPDGTLSSYGAHIPGGFYDVKAAERLIVYSLLCERMEAGFNGFVWCYLLERRVIEEAHIRFTGAYLEDELFLIEYFAIGSTLAVTDQQLYRYSLNPASVTRRYLKNYVQTFDTSFEIKKQLVEKYRIAVAKDWKETTLWAGLFIAIGNEFAPGNPDGPAQRRKNLRSLCTQESFAEAVKSYKPSGMGRRKALVAALVRARQYRLLAALYEIKNRNRS